MAFTKYQIFLALLLVVTGSLNTLTTKYADKIHSKGKDGKVREFNHPFVQACFMFLGEMLCLLTFKFCYYTLRRRQNGSEDNNTLTKGNRQFNPFVLLIPALCDMTATSTMYIGLSLTYASSFQMLRGSVIIFVALLSFCFLGRTPVVRQIFGIFFIIFGLGLVGYADIISDAHPDFDRTKIIIGDVLIVLAQIITATQMVFEEKFVGGLDIPPLQAVGWEGIFGFTILSALLVPMYFIKLPENIGAAPDWRVEDAIDAVVQIYNDPHLVLAIFGTISSIAFFNFAGISVTKEISATTRMVLDSVRTLVIWIVSLAIQWQAFHVIQVYGFVSLISGMCIYNDLVIPPFLRKCRAWIRSCRGRSQADPEAEAIVNQPADSYPEN